MKPAKLDCGLNSAGQAIYAIESEFITAIKWVLKMYERLLDKQKQPTFDEFTAHCGDGKRLLEKADVFLTN